MKIAIIGKGNVGTHLYNAFKDGFAINWYGRAYPKKINADVIIVSVSDDATIEVASSIEAPLVVHTAGAIAKLDGTQHGVLYPLYSFTKGEAVDFQRIPWIVEANTSEQMSLLKQLVDYLGSKSYEISSDQRKNLHAAAVLVNNFTNHLYTLAEEHCSKHNVPFEVLHAIMRQGPEKAIALGAKRAQTGPALRNDASTMEQHVQSIEDEQVKDLYRHISKSIQNTHEL